MTRRAVSRCFPCAVVLAGVALLASAYFCWVGFGTAAPKSTPDTLADWRGGVLPGRSAADYSRGSIVRVEVAFEDGSVQVILPGDPVVAPTTVPTATPTASATPTATVAPTVPPTNTPRATATETPYPTPTPEVTVLPTLTATTPPKTCSLRATVTLRVRSGAGVEFGQVDNWFTGDEKTFTEFAFDASEAYLWGRHDTGWSAVFWQQDASGAYQGQWLAAGGEGGETCRDVGGWPWNLYPPEPVAFLDGFHTLAGEGVGVVLAPEFVGKYHLLKCLDGGFSVCEQAKTANPEIKTIYRTYQHDCPPKWWEGNSEAWWNYIEGKLPPGADWYEVMNECDPELDRAGAWAQAMIEMALIIERERPGASLLAFSSGPGNPDFPWWRPMWVYVDWSAERNRTHGTQHGIALHSSVYAPDSITLPSDSWINNPFIAGREKIVCELAAANNYGASCDGIVIIDSEIGWGDGYQGNKDEFSCAEQGLMYRDTIVRKSEDGVDGFALWSVGKVGNWLSVHDCMYAILS